MLQAVKRSYAIDRKDPRLHECLVKFLHTGTNHSLFLTMIQASGPIEHSLVKPIQLTCIFINFQFPSCRSRHLVTLMIVLFYFFLLSIASSVRPSIHPSIHPSLGCSLLLPSTMPSVISFSIPYFLLVFK